MATVRQFQHANQFTITNGNSLSFQSYKSLICEFDKVNKVLKVFPDWCYSNTTSRHFYKWLNEFVGINPTRKDLLKETKQINNISICYMPYQVYN